MDLMTICNVLQTDSRQVFHEERVHAFDVERVRRSLWDLQLRLRYLCFEIVRVVVVGLG